MSEGPALTDLRPAARLARETPTSGGIGIGGSGALLGLLAGGAVLAIAIALGGRAFAFIDPSALLIVIGGTLAVLCVCFSPGEVAAMLASLAAILIDRAPDPRAAAMTALRLAGDARRYGLLHFEQKAVLRRQPPFLRKALAMVADGGSETELEAVLRHDVVAASDRLRDAALVLRRAADYAPAMGLIGTLIGLVHMLGQLSDPQRIGPSMAVALLTTFYGAVLANMVCSPLAVKLERRADEEETVCRIFLMGAVSISRRENPRRLELLLDGMLPPARRLRAFDR